MDELHTFPFFFFNDTAPTEIYTLSLHDALPISNFAAYGLGWGLRDYRGHKIVSHTGGLARMTSRTLLHVIRSEEPTSALQSPDHLVCRLLLEKKTVSISRAPPAAPPPGNNRLLS